MGRRRTYAVVEHSNILNRDRIVKGNLEELKIHYRDVLEKGFEIWKTVKSGRVKINTNPNTIESLIRNLNQARSNAASVKDIRTIASKTFKLL